MTNMAKIKQFTPEQLNRILLCVSRFCKVFHVRLNDNDHFAVNQDFESVKYEFEKIKIEEFISQLSIGQRLILLASFKSVEDAFRKAYLMQQAIYFKELLNLYADYILQHDRQQLTSDEILKLEELKNSVSV